jgi:hypothetical protein
LGGAGGETEAANGNGKEVLGESIHPPQSTINRSPRQPSACVNFGKTPYNLFFMGQQLKTVAKRRRRVAYLERKKESAKVAKASAASKAKK